MEKIKVGDIVLYTNDTRPKYDGETATVVVAGREGSVCRYKVEFKDGYKVHTNSDHLKLFGDPVNSPDHYTAGGIESIDYIQAKLTPEAFQGFCLGNVLKYVGRAGKKGDARTQDLEKAQVYLGWALDSINERKLNK